MITWDDSMSTGVPTIDAQHKVLIQKFNELAEALSDSATARETAEEILDFLQFYAAWHFGREEKCMEEYHCPVAAQNKQAHAEFTRTFNAAYVSWQEGNMTQELAYQTYQEVKVWLMNHILGTDTQLRHCVKAASSTE